MNKKRPVFAVFACGPVGEMAIKLFDESKDQLVFVMLDKDNFWNWNDQIIKMVSGFGNIPIYYYESDEDVLLKTHDLDAVILAYWGKIISKELIESLKYGYINLHTSFLPYGKGKHAHYWAIRDNTPFGVTIMKIDEGLDTGDILYQREIPVSWEDTAKSLYFKALSIMGELLDEKKHDILELDMVSYRQKGQGSMHYSREMVSKIDLDKAYSGRELLNLLRAKMFDPISVAYFTDNGDDYEVSVSIKKKQKEESPIDYKSLASSFLRLD